MSSKKLRDKCHGGLACILDKRKGPPGFSPSGPADCSATLIAQRQSRCQALKGRLPHAHPINLDRPPIPAEDHVQGVIVALSKPWIGAVQVCGD